VANVWIQLHDTALHNLYIAGAFASGAKWLVASSCLSVSVV